jgi:hypothetical protein
VTAALSVVALVLVKIQRADRAVEGLRFVRQPIGRPVAMCIRAQRERQRRSRIGQAADTCAVDLLVGPILHVDSIRDDQRVRDGP